jgi:hypothetical protein
LAKHLHDQGILTPSGKRIWSLATLRAILRQPAYTGQVYAGRNRYRPPRIRRSATHEIGHSHDTAVEQPPEEWIPVASVPAIISQEQFEVVQRKLATNQSFAARNNKTHPVFSARIGELRYLPGRLYRAQAAHEPHPSMCVPARARSFTVARRKNARRASLQPNSWMRWCGMICVRC